MSSRSNSKLFSFSFSELIQLSNNLCVVLTRDLTELSIFGLTSTNITNLSTLTVAFENSRTDIEYEGNVRIKTEEKNILAEQSLEQIRFMNVRVEAAFGLNSVIYENFKFGDINAMTDRYLLETLRRIIRMADEYITELTPYGVTPALITTLTELADDFSAALTEQEKAMDARRLASANRTAKANEIYLLISNYANFGKKLYAKSNPAKYEDYVIYEKVTPGLPDKPSMLWFQYPERTIWWNPVDNATSYQLEKLEGTEYVEIFSGNADNFPFVPPDGLSKYRVRGRNANGFGPFSDVLEQWYFAVLPKASNLQIVRSETILTLCTVTCDPVPTVVEYRFYQSIDDIGQAPAHWAFLSLEEVPSRLCNLTLGKRNYFRIECSNMSQYSLSDPVFIDVYE